MTYFYINEDLVTEDRYDLAKFLQYEKGSYSFLNSYFIDKIKKLSPAGKYTCTNERPELISYKIYGDVQFYWVIMMYNDCLDFADGTFGAGKVISYPSISDIERLMFTLKSLARAQQ